jgi:hypothetical protein
LGLSGFFPYNAVRHSLGFIIAALGDMTLSMIIPDGAIHPKTLSTLYRMF